MNEMIEQLWFDFNVNNKVGAFNSEVMKSVLKQLDHFLPVKPELLMCSNRPLIKIEQFDCDAVLKALDKYLDVVQIYDEKKDIVINIMQKVSRDSTFVLWIKSELVKKMNPLTIKEFFLNVNSLITFTYASCHFRNNRKYLFENYYEKISERSFLCEGLYWLNFFGHEEEERQGGQALEVNPYASEIKRMDNGLFIRVGDSPFDCYTEAGEKRLIAATKAMPPQVRWN